MKLINKQIAELDLAADFLEKQISKKMNFEHTVSTYTEIFNFDNKIRYSFSDSFKNFRELHLMQATKKEIAANIGNADLSENYASKVNYFKYSKELYEGIEPGEIKTFAGNITEIDISAAYFYCARNLNLISQPLFEKIISLPKQKRLPILGSIASKKLKYTYREGEIFGEIEVIQNRELRQIWFLICYEIDKLIIHASQIAGVNFLFYYVDGIYFYDKFNLAESIEKLFTNSGFLCKFKRVNSIEVINKISHYQIKLIKSDLEQKTFNFAPEKIRYIHNGKRI